MPYFKWHGIAIDGKDRSGYRFARSVQDLDSELCTLGIALLKTRNHSWLIKRKKISIEEKSEMFAFLKDLLEHGLPISDACAIIGKQSENPKIQESFLNTSEQIKNGIPIYNAFSAFPVMFDEFACQAIAVGQATNTVDIACQLLSSYFQMHARFGKKIKNALMVPLITAGFIAAAMLLFILFFIPHVSDIFKTMHVTLPPSTEKIISLSRWLGEPLHIITIGMVGLAMTGFLILAKKTKHYIYIKESVTFATPYLNTIVIAYTQAQFFSFLSVLLKSGVQLNHGVDIIKSITRPDTKLYHATLKISSDLDSGVPLSRALAQHMDLFSTHQIAVVAIAEEINTLGPTCEKISVTAFDLVDQKLNRLAFWVGPAMLTVLGFCIALLIIGIYSPLMHLSFTVGQ